MIKGRPGRAFYFYFFHIHLLFLMHSFEELKWLIPLCQTKYSPNCYAYATLKLVGRTRKNRSKKQLLKGVCACGSRQQSQLMQCCHLVFWKRKESRDKRKSRKPAVTCALLCGISRASPQYQRIMPVCVWFKWEALWWD